jgi:hypothetical protein
MEHEKLSLEVDVLDYDRLDEVVGAADLRSRLEEWGYHLIHHDGRRLIRLSDWYEFVGRTLQRVEELEGERAQRELEELKSKLGLERAVTGSVWNERRTRLFRRHPAVERLLQEFLAAVQARTPDARVKLNPSTVTVTSPDGIRTGIRFRTSGLWLVGTRQTSEGKGVQAVWVRSASDIDDGIAFLLGDRDGEPTG